MKNVALSSPKKYCFLVFLFLPGIRALAQDSVMVKDTMPKVDIGEITVHRPALKKGMILVPLTMIAYGALSLDNGELKAIDREVKEELWLEKSHKPLKIDNYLQWAPAAAVYGLNAVGIKGRHNFKDRSIIYGMSMAFMSGTVFATKHLSKQLRPDDSNNQSFPSGHTANAFAGAEFLRREYWDTSPWIGVAGYAVAGITGYLRMYNNRHWMSDVVAGAGVGILSTNLAYYLYPTVKKVFSGKKENNSNIVAPFYNQGAVGLSLVHNF